MRGAGLRDRRRLRAVGAGGAILRTAVQGPCQRPADRFQSKGLGHKVADAQPHGFNAGIETAIAGQEDGAQVRAKLHRPANDHQAVHFRHVEIGEEDLIGLLLQHREAFWPIAGLADFDPLLG